MLSEYFCDHMKRIPDIPDMIYEASNDVIIAIELAYANFFLNTVYSGNLQ